MNPQLVTLVQQLQALTASIAALVIPTNPSGTVPLNVQAAYATLQTATAQLSTDISAATFVIATVQADLVNVQAAVTNLATALASPSTP
jgi:sensor histidine kinase regulating citrate/malate metabolism